MHPAATDLKAFSDSVEQTLPLLGRLHEVILEERQALTGREPGQLESVVQAKLALLDQITPLLQSRDALQQRLGASPGLAGGDKLMGSAPAGSQIRQHWESLKQIAQAVEQDNALNGQLAIQGEKATRMGISLLTGRANEPGTYGPKGENTGSLSGLTLAKA